MNGPPLSVGRLDNRRTSLLFKLLLLREHWRRDANRPRFNCCSLRAGLQFLGWRSPQRRNCGDQGRYDYQAGAPLPFEARSMLSRWLIANWLSGYYHAKRNNWIVD